MTRILGICASPYKQGNTATILATALAGAKKFGVKIETIYLPLSFPRIDGRRDEEKHNLDTRISMLPARGGLRKIVRKILNADGVIFATPTRCFNMDPLMLDLFCWLMVTTDYPEYALENKVAGYISVCEEDGAQSANEKMMSPATHLGFATAGFCTHFFNKNAKESEGNWQIEGQPLVGEKVLELAEATQYLRDED